MKTYQKKQVTREETYLVEMKCDLCSGTSRNDDWTTGSYEVNETQIRWKEGDSYPEGGSGTEIEVDICPECFKTKLIPWLESQGAAIRKKEWDW
jgi:hypothetical protein